MIRAIIIGLPVCLGLAFGLASRVAAQVRAGDCYPSAMLRTALADKGEVVVSMGMTPFGSLVEMWGSKDGAWTITESYAEGKSCIRAFGHGFEDAAAEPAGVPG